MLFPRLSHPISHFRFSVYAICMVSVPCSKLATLNLGFGTVRTLSILICCLLTKSCLFVTPWTVAHQAPLSMGFFRQEYWSGLPFPTSGNFPDPGVEPVSSVLAGRVSPLSHLEAPHPYLAWSQMLKISSNNSTYVSMHFPLLDTSYKWNHTIWDLLVWLLSLTITFF